MTSPRSLLKAWGVYPKKQLGQNFLADPGTARMIVEKGRVAPAHVIFEIGAGLGALTVPLAKAAKKVYAVEKDAQLIRLLETELKYSGAENVSVLARDILSVDIQQISNEEGSNLIVFGNLPYNISSQILVKLIANRDCISRCILMFQKELADRLISPPGRKAYGRISVMLQYCAGMRALATVHARLFFPKPKVDSEIIEINFSKPPRHYVKNESFFFSVVKAAFSKRRKTLKNSLSTSELGMTAVHVLQALTAADIDPRRRAETLTVAEFAAMGNALYDLQG